MESQVPSQAPASDSAPRPIGAALASTLERLKQPYASDEEIAVLERDEEPRRRRAALERLIREAGGGRFADYSLPKFIASNPKQAAVKSAVEEWVATFPERQKRQEGIVLYGPVGTGKDHLAFGAVGAVVIQYGATAAYRNGRDLMSEVRDRIGADKPEAALIASLEAPDVLVLSDPLPPRGDLTDFQADVLYRVVENRSAARRLTVCTLNIENDSEADRRLGAPTWDRLCDRAWKMACFWESYRRPAREVK